MSPETSRSAPSPQAVAAGADVGCTLVKLALRNRDGAIRFESLPSTELDRAAERIAHSRAEAVGLTGGGAPQLERRLASQSTRVDEFTAWSTGAREMLRAQGDPPERFLLVSVGTGTSAMLVDGANVVRAGGTALGGGTVLGLCAALLNRRRFEDIATLAASGDRRRVDLLIGDVYPEGDFPLPPELNASSFARLARLPEGQRSEAADLAHGVMGLVGENVALICCGLAAATKVERIVFGGATLRDNPSLVAILRGVSLALGRQPTFLPQGEFAGALGALERLDRVGA